MKHQCSTDCTAGWSSTRRAHCAACGENFSTPANFDKHKPGDCLPPAQCGLVQNDRGTWVTEGEDERFQR